VIAFFMLHSKGLSQAISHRTLKWGLEWGDEVDVGIFALCVATLATLAADQGSKHFVLQRLAEGEALGGGWLRIRRVTNRHGWLRMGQQRGVLLLVWAIAIIGVGSIAIAAHDRNQPTLSLCLGLALGGATANVWDWVWRRGVVDFIDLRLWPVFNVGDVAIVVGVAGAIWCLR
jgi:signal peptidase II